MRHLPIAFLTVVVACAGVTCQAQDFVKKLEEQLKQQLGPGSKTIGDKSKEDPGKPSSNKPTEDLPTPSQSTPSQPTQSKDGPTAPFTLPDILLGDVPRSPAPAPPKNPNANPPTTPSPFIPTEEERSVVVPGNPELDPASGLGQPGYLGLVAEKIPGGGIGLSVVEVVQGSPAWKAGFQNGDRILAVSGAAVSDLDQLAKQLGLSPAGKAVKFLINRNGRSKELTAVPLDRGIAARTQPMLNDNGLPGTGFSGVGNSPVNGLPAVGRATLGLSVANLSDYFRRQFGIAAFRGAAVTEVAKGSPAEQVGIKPGDCVVEIDGQVIQSAAELQEWVLRARPGQLAVIGFYRGRGFNQGQLIVGSEGGVGPGIPMNGNSISPEYVSSLQGELERMRAELERTQRRMVELEQKLRALERN